MSFAESIVRFFQRLKNSASTGGGAPAAHSPEKSSGGQLHALCFTSESIRAIAGEIGAR